MPPADYDASALAVPYRDDSPDVHNNSSRVSSSSSPLWTRRSGDSERRRSFASDRPADFRSRLWRNYSKLNRQALKTYNSLSLVQRVGVIVLAVVTLVLGILFLVYNERIFGWLEPYAKRWRELPGGWAILWAMTFVVSFPPLIGYSTCVTIAGFVFGFPNG